jgi:hypothetical protein
MVKVLNLKNFIKITVFLILLLGLVSLLIGSINIYRAKEERNDIYKINDMFSKSNINDTTKSEVNKFMKSYPRMKNIIVTDEKGSIVYSNNNNFINGKQEFILIPARERNGVLLLKGTEERFISVSRENDEISKQNHNNSEQNNRDRWFVQGRNVMFGANPRPVSNKQPQFVNSFYLTEAKLNVYYLAGDFKETGLIKTLFITQILLRISFIVLWILSFLWILKDSRRRGLNHIAWGLFGLFTGIIGLIIYIIYKKNNYFCSICENRIDKSWNYCKHCGTSLKLECEDCKERIESDSKFCVNCGRQIN